MTLKELERYLKIQKLQEGARRGADMCGRYARCAYCDRFEQYPCAKAHNAYVRALSLGAAQSSELCPEPPVEEVFGAKIAEDEQAEPAPAQAVVKKAEEEKKAEPVKKPQSRGAVRRGKGEVRVLSLKRKPHPKAEGGN